MTPYRSATTPLSISTLLVMVLLAASCSTGKSPVAEATSEPRGNETPGANPATPGAEEIEWGGCASEMAASAQLQCGTLEVPTDHDSLDGGTTELELARSRSTGSAEDKIGSLLINPGGPGGSGIEALAGLSLVLPEELQSSFDLVSWDPRGVAESSPVVCLSDQEKDEQLEGDISPDNPEAFDRAVEDQEQLREACETNNPDIIEHMSTADVAADLDLIRSALGDDELNYLGFSYGTAIGAAYATMFPDNTRALVLDGAVSPNATDLEASVEQAQGFENTYQNFLTACSTDPECALGSDPGAVVDATRERLETEPLTVKTSSGTRELTRDLFDLGLATSLYDTSLWGMSARAIANLDDGGGAVTLAFADNQVGREPDGSWDNSGDAQIMVSCADSTERPTIAQATENAGALAAASPTFGEAFATSALGCVDWPLAVNPTPQFSGTGADPLLVIGTIGDPATPYHWSEEMEESLESAELLTYEGDGHTAFTRGGPCIDDAVVDYFINLTMPTGLTCEAQTSAISFEGIRGLFLDEFESAGIPISTAECITGGVIEELGESQMELALIQGDTDLFTGVIQEKTIECMSGG